MKGIETGGSRAFISLVLVRSDHCPAMKGIETSKKTIDANATTEGSDHCPAMKGIETGACPRVQSPAPFAEATTAPQ